MIIKTLYVQVRLISLTTPSGECSKSDPGRKLPIESAAIHALKCFGPEAKISLYGDYSCKMLFWHVWLKKKKKKTFFTLNPIGFIFKPHIECLEH